MLNNKFRSLVIILFGIVVTIGLFSYDYSDPCWSLNSDYMPKNILGILGANISDVIVQFFGITSFIIPLAIIFNGFRTYFNKSNFILFDIFNSLIWILIINLGLVIGSYDMYMFEYSSTGSLVKIIDSYNQSYTILIILISYKTLDWIIRYSMKYKKTKPKKTDLNSKKPTNSKSKSNWNILAKLFTFIVSKAKKIFTKEDPYLAIKKSNFNKKIDDEKMRDLRYKDSMKNSLHESSEDSTAFHKSKKLDDNDSEAYSNNTNIRESQSNKISYNRHSRYQDDLFVGARAANKLVSKNLSQKSLYPSYQKNEIDPHSKAREVYQNTSKEIYQGTSNNLDKDDKDDFDEVSKISKYSDKKPLYQEQKENLYLNYKFPTIDFLKSTSKSVKQQSFEEIKQNSDSLLKVLNDFGVDGIITDVHQGPVVTSYEFEPKPGIKVSRVIGLADDIARSLSAISTRIDLVPGKGVLMIEIPNSNRHFFKIKELIEFVLEQCVDMSLPIILGKDQLGMPLVIDLAKMPHLLVAGTTGSGKSVAINTMIFSLLYKHSPADCKFIMIDPKMLELNFYADIPHLLAPIITESTKAVSALKWVVKEMENRYKMMSNLNVRNINSYNTKVLEITKESQVLDKEVHTGFDDHGNPTYETISIKLKKMPFIVIVIDEMADLMLTAGKEIENLIQRLAQMARAAGIHIIMATQRPSVDIITGVIKANLPSRISFKVISKIDSRTILGQMGAEQLLGMGDMLYLGNTQKIMRAHGAFVDDFEVEKLVEFLKQQGKPNYVKDILSMSGNIAVKTSKNEDDPQLYQQALNIIKRDRKTQANHLQKVLRVSHSKALLLIDELEQNGVISAPSVSGQREIID